MKYSCLVFCEGRRDKNFLYRLFGLNKFKYHTRKWVFTSDNASGSAPSVILKQCRDKFLSADYDLCLCFIDLDKLKQDFPGKWEQERERLEKEYVEIEVIWQVENAEDEYRTVLGQQFLDLGKGALNRAAGKNVDKFVNSKYYGRILKRISDREMKLDS